MGDQFKYESAYSEYRKQENKKVRREKDEKIYDPNDYIEVFRGIKCSKCAYNDHGHECQELGVMSHQTLGKGAWYCKKHFRMTG